MEDRPGPRDARSVAHGRVVGIAHPYAHDDIRREAHRPVVAGVSRRARFGGDGEGECERTLRAEFLHAGGTVTQDIGDEPCNLRVENLFAS